MRISDGSSDVCSSDLPYARQLAGMFADNPAVLEELLDGLFHIAHADGRMAEEEVSYLGRLAEIFGFDARAWDRIRAANMVTQEKCDPFCILGVSRDASDTEIRDRKSTRLNSSH